MKRIDTVFDKLKELDNGTGVTTEEIADSLGLSRANVSSDLNKLCEEGKASKSGVRPVLYNVVEKNLVNPMPILDKFAIKNPSLYSAIEQAKAAVLYPPKGMHILILGETGVGKSMFAGLVHKYAIEMERMEESSPFVIFNCADYANNPQLLLSQLFGTKKGAYTGADMDKPGLIEKANGGILFLDEVHRLPPEGQEMFFTFMDRGTYRRLGETDIERVAKVLIISATTENPDSSLLKTFTRRIPMIIRLSNLNERTMEERLIMVGQFMREESSRLGKAISVSINSMKAFISYHCPNNIGQLKTDIQLVCAKAYADYVSNKKEDIKIVSSDLPPYIKQGLYEEIEHHQLWNKLIGINKRYCVFNESEDKMLFEEEENEKSIYDLIDIRVHELKSKGISVDSIEKEMEKDIEEYFSNYLQNVNKNMVLSNLETHVGKEIIRVTEEIVKYSEERLAKTISEKVFYGMAVHIANAVERVRRNKKIINPQLNKIRSEHSNEFDTAIDCLKIIGISLDISMPIDEAGFLTMFLVYNEGNFREEKRKTQVIVIAHGATTATSMAEAANSLFGVKFTVGINAPMDEKPQQVLSRLKNYIVEAGINSDILLLVDMGSLTNFGEEIEQEFGMKTQTISLVSTLHVIEATRKAIMGCPLDKVYKETLAVNELSGIRKNESKTIEEREAAKKLCIVTLCTTGEGSALAIKNILQKILTFDKNILEIVPVNIVGKDNIYEKLKRIENESKIICVVSSFHFDIDIIQFGIDEVLNNYAIYDIQNLIDIETTYINLYNTFLNQLHHIDGKEVFKNIKKFIKSIEEKLAIRLNTNVLIGITMHIACMLDRVISGGQIEKYDEKEDSIKGNPELYTLVKKECEKLNKIYDINITDDEVCYIMLFFNPENNI